MGSMLRQVEYLPEAFIDAQPQQLADLLGGPTKTRESPLS